MMTVTTIGLDLATSVFQAQGIDANGATVLLKKLHRKEMLPFFVKLPPCLIGVEACGTAHYWAGTLSNSPLGTPMADWIRKLSEKKPFRVVSVALATKLARIAWVLLTRKVEHQPYAHVT